ncbi:YoaP domain-containing protein [Clostridium sp. DL1XJH146]
MQTSCTNYAVFIDGKFVTSEVLTEKKLMKFLSLEHL